MEIIRGDHPQLTEREILLSHVYRRYHDQSSHINNDVCDILVNCYFGRTDLYNTLRLLLSHLVREVDNAGFSDLEYDNTDDEIVLELHDYCFKYDVNDKLLAITFGKFLTLNEGLAWDSYGEMIQEVITMIRSCVTIPDEENEYLWINLGFLDSVNSDLEDKKRV